MGRAQAVVVPSPETVRALDAIRSFARGNAMRREEAIRSYRDCVARGMVVKEYPELLFMREVDCVSPDLVLRRVYRLKLQGVDLTKGRVQ